MVLRVLSQILQQVWMVYHKHGSILRHRLLSPRVTVALHNKEAASLVMSVSFTLFRRLSAAFYYSSVLLCLDRYEASRADQCETVVAVGVCAAP